jgi:hypothetical protein
VLGVISIDIAEALQGNSTKKGFWTKKSYQLQDILPEGTITGINGYAICMQVSGHIRVHQSRSLFFMDN